jgi:hypothetical protein
MPPPRRTRRLTVEGNHVLYHFLQKTLLESDAAQFQQLTAHLVAALGIWLPPGTYGQYPLLVPYAVRDPTCRGNRSKGTPDAWGAPNAAGLFRDDNSLIKNLPRSLAVGNPSNRLFDGRYMGTSFVASHVWRELVPRGQASRERATYSFVPNLVWLPSQVSKLSDREGSFVQTYLQALSWRIYHDIELSPGLKEVVDPIWERLSLRPEAAEVDLPDRSTLNFFQFDEKWIARRVSTLGSVIQALETVLSGEQPQRKTVSRRYTEGLSDVPRSSVVRLLAELRIYSEAVQEARSPVTAPDGLADLAEREPSGRRSA